MAAHGKTTQVGETKETPEDKEFQGTKVEGDKVVTCEDVLENLRVQGEGR